MTPAPVRFTTTAIFLHWFAAVLIFAAFPLGLYMSGLTLSPTMLKLFSYHKWLGVTVFVLTVARLVWRAGHAAPALPEAIPAWQRRASAGVHHLLYLLLFAVPLTGWLMSSAKGFQTVYLGVLPIPDVLPKDKALGEQLAAVHEVLSWAMMLLLVPHIGAALKHHFVTRNDVLIRMVPWLAKVRR